MIQTGYDYGIIGLGTMGRNLLYNINDHEYSAAGFDKDKSKVKLLQKEAGKRNIAATSDIHQFIKILKIPRVIILLVPAGKIVDDVIAELQPLLSKNDLLMDCGNSHFTDTDARYKHLANSSIHFMGVGVSGGESGARHGPSIMPGGPKKAYSRVAPMLEKISAKVKNEPCVKWLGPGSAGHYVKMVHNGIEYGIMQLIAESYHLLKKVCQLSNEELHETFSQWNNGALHSFLIEITADIFIQKDDLTKNSLIDMILDNAHQKGTGGWTSEDALKLQIPIPVIDIAVSMRDLSSRLKERKAAYQKLKGQGNKFEYDKKSVIRWLEQALYFSMIVTYAQGMSQLYAASEKYKYELNLKDIAGIWRGGCIIRSSILDDMCVMLKGKRALSNIILYNAVSKKLMQAQIDIRKIVTIGVENGIPIPAFSGALAYYDSFSSGWLPANLIQAQRDYFGAHTYERIDRSGTFHTHWEPNT